MSAQEEPKPDAVPGGEAPPASGGGKLTLILTAVNMLATLGMGAVLFISFQHEKNKPQMEDIVTAEHGGGEEAPAGGEGEGAKGEHGAAAKGHSSAGEYGKMVTLEQFVVNLSTPGSVTPKFVRVNISLEVPGDDAEEEVNQKMPQVRNTVIDLFNSKRPADLATAEGRDYLKEEIRNALNSFMIAGKVKGVFFTNFALTG